jgi:hypothetical protein
MVRLVLGALALVIISGCSTLNPAVRSVRTLDANRSALLTTDATLRSTYMLIPDNNPDADLANRILCVEPQPDAATQLAARASLSGAGGRIGQDASADAVLEYNSTIVQLAGRSSTVLLARDFLFNVCLLRANGFLTDLQVYDLYLRTITLVGDIAAADKLQSAADAIQSGAPAGTVATILDVNELELMVTVSAVGLSRISDEAARRALLTRIFACPSGNNTCIGRRDRLIAERDLTAMTTQIGDLTRPQIEALYAALNRSP